MSEKEKKDTEEMMIERWAKFAMKSLEKDIFQSIAPPLLMIGLDKKIIPVYPPKKGKNNED